MYILNRLPRFEWDPDKARINKSKHGISFEVASTGFDDPLQLRFDDTMHSTLDEQRSILVGRVDDGIILTIVFTQRGEVLRLISARRAHRKERKRYYEQQTESQESQ